MMWYLPCYLHSVHKHHKMTYLNTVLVSSVLVKVSHYYRKLWGCWTRFHWSLFSSCTVSTLGLFVFSHKVSTSTRPAWSILTTLRRSVATFITKQKSKRRLRGLCLRSKLTMGCCRVLQQSSSHCLLGPCQTLMAGNHSLYPLSLGILCSTLSSLSTLSGSLS